MIDNVDELYSPLVDPFVQRVTADIYAFRHCDGTSQNPSCVAITSKNDEASAHTRQTLFVGGKRERILGTENRTAICSQPILCSTEQ